MATTPSYRTRMSRGKRIALVTLRDSKTGRRRDYQLGKPDSPESREKYFNLLSEWQSSGRRLPRVKTTTTSVVDRGPIVSQLCMAYAQDRPENDPNSYTIASTIKLLGEMHGDLAATEFGPNALRQFREAMIVGDAKKDRQPLCRSEVVKRTSLAIRIFKWAVAHEYIDESVWRRLTSLEQLDHRRTDIKANRKIFPVPIGHVRRVQAIVSKQVAAMIELQMLTGGRVQELLWLKPEMLDRSKSVWKVDYGEEHKTGYKGKRRVIYFGPKSQTVLMPFLLRHQDAYLFNPAEAEQERLRIAHKNRKTPETYGNRPGTNIKENPKKKPRDHYDADSYRRCITRACKKCGVPVWTPRQLRHNAASMIEEQYDSVVAAIMLGHSSAKITEAVYIQRDTKKAVEVSTAIG